MISHEIVKSFAKTRNPGLNFSFLKENGELLQIAVSSGLKIESRSLGLYEDMYKNILNLHALYPPFFRFFLAITLDLEALGMSGNKGEVLSDYVLKHKLFDHETSDTRRWEITNLLARTGRKPDYQFDSREHLEARTHGFFGTPDRFVKFNRPLFYDLTHIIFFWTNYGKLPFAPSNSLLHSLSNVGLLAYLDDDLDLLAEVCMCFKFVGGDAPNEWVKTCESGLDTLSIDFVSPQTSPNAAQGDEYHIYVVLNWFMKQFGHSAFTEKFTNKLPVFSKKPTSKSTLATLSHRMHSEFLLGKRSVLDPKLKVTSFLSEAQLKHLEAAKNSTPYGDEFFDKFFQGIMTFS